MPASLPEHVRLLVIMQLASAPSPVDGADAFYWTPSASIIFPVEWTPMLQQEMMMPTASFFDLQYVEVDGV